MIVGSGAAMGARYQVLKEALGECLINEKGEFYTRNSKLTANMYVVFVFFSIVLAILGISIFIFFKEEFIDEDIFYMRILLMTTPFTVSIFLVRAKAFVFDKWILTRDSIIVKNII